MTKIAYLYYGHMCPIVHLVNPPPEIHDWYYFLPEAIGAEMSGETGAIVARFGPVCQEGRRWDYNGLGGERILYYGGSAQDGAITGPMGHSLNKMTDFYKELNPPSNLPSRKQNQVEPTKVWDGCNIETDLTYDDSGRVASIHHPDDGSTYYYDRVNHGASVTPPDPSRIHNTHHHWLFNKTDELGKVTTYTRDARRRVTRIDYPDNGGYETFEYDNNNPNGLNQVTSHRLPSNAVQTYVYDPTTHLLVLEYNSANEERRAYTYDALGRVETMRDARALADGAPYTERMEYNGWHQITKIHYRATGGSGDPTATYEYDNYGNRTAVIDELGHRKDYTYDSYRRCTSMTEQTGSSAGCNNVQERRWDWIYDREIEYGPNDRAMFRASAHTSKEWRIQIEPEFNGEHHRRATARVFDVNNRMISEETGLIQLPTEDLGKNLQVVSETGLHSFAYNGNGQKEKFTDNSLNRETTYTYDRRNRLETTTEPKRLGQLNSTTRFYYDVAGNKTMVTFPDMKTQRWENYDAFGQPRQFFDEYNRPTDFTYWPWGPMKKLAEVNTHREKDGGGPDEDQRTQFFYDLMGRPTWTFFPDGSSELNAYELGTLSAFKTRKNQTKRLHYDARGREDYETWDAGAAPRIDRVWDDASRLSNISNIFSTIAYTYDVAGQVRTESTTVAGDGVARTVGYCRNPSGDVTQITYPNGTVVNRFYTARGQLKGVGWGENLSTSYEYNRDGTVNYQARTNNVTTTYGYDGRGIISSMQHTKGQALAKRDYWQDDRDRIRAWKRGSDHNVNPMEDGRGNRYEYDYEGQLIRASYRAENPENGATNPYRNEIFQYDKMGNRKGWNYLANRGSMLFQGKNNGLNQYFSWENSFPPPGALHWGTTTNYDDDLPGWGGPHEANGVLMQEGWITGFYNALNQPVGMTTTGWIGTGTWMWFGYDPLGRCVKRWTGPNNGQVPPAYTNPATYYYYDGLNLIQEGASGVAPSRVYVHGGRTDEIVASWAGGNWNQHQYDAQGNCILLTDSGGNIMEQYDYDAFGYPYFYSSTGQQLSSPPSGNRFLFTGREWVKELRVYDYRARMYQPELGRFLQPDPQEFEAGDYNLYRYCHNDPVNKSDPTGLGEIANEIQRDFQWDVARYSDAANTSQGSFADFTHGAYLGNTGGGGSATVTGMPTRQANPAPKSDTPTSDSTKSMKMTIAMDPANPGQPSFEDGGDYRIFRVQFTQPNGKAQDGRGYYAQEEIKVRVNQCSGDDCVNGAFKVRTTNGKPLYELPRSGQAADRVGMGYHPAPGTSGTVIKDQRWWLQHGTEHKTLLPGVLRQTTTTNGGKSYNSIAPTSVPW